MSSKRLLYYNNFNAAAVSTGDLMSGANGALSLNGTTAYITAGDIKRYSSISIINNGQLIVMGFDYTSGVNSGKLPALIGCSGNCTINTGGRILAQDNAGDAADFYGTVVYSAPTVPFDTAIGTVSYTRTGGYGGSGGESGSTSNQGGGDQSYGSGPYPTGHGGGGAGKDYGGDTQGAASWGSSGIGSEGTASIETGGLTPTIDGFGANGVQGTEGEDLSPGGYCVGGGGGAGLRGLSGGAVLLQVGGASNIDANSIQVQGRPGGNGGNGGNAACPLGTAIGGGGGGSGCGGSGGYGWIYYKTGTVDPGAVSFEGGAAGTPGAGGVGTGANPEDGYAGNPGAGGADGGSTIATY